MMSSELDQVFAFDFGERYMHRVVPYTRLELDAPSEPGLYSWHFRLPRERPDRAAAFLKSLFQAAELQVTVNANMRQRWNGTLETEVDPFSRGISTALGEAFFAIAYPLYIGIATDMRSRLKTHKKQLEIYKDALPAPAAFTAEPDSDDESRCFGSRLGAVFRQARFYETELLYVKCVSWRSGAAEEQATIMNGLRSAEWTCNTLFHPVFGRR